MAGNEQAVISAAAAGQQPNTVQQRPGFESFAHLLHFTGVGDPPLGLVLEPRSLNPGFWTRDGVKKNDALQKILEEMVDQNPQFKKLRMALVDLTDDKLRSPHFAGLQELEHGTVGSSAKMGVMYAAYQLKFDLEVLAKDLEIKKKDLFDAARDYWSLTQIDPPGAPPVELFPDDPKLELHGSLVKKDGQKMSLECQAVQKDGKGKVLSSTPVKIGAPKLEEIFDVQSDATGALTVAFTDAFKKKIKLMTRHSDNNAAHDCITAIGYLYLDSALWQSDLYNPRRHGGIWLGGSYPKTIAGGNTLSILWQPAPVGDRDRKNPTRQCGTAAAAAALLTLLEQDDLVNKDASTEMRNEMLDIKASDGYSSWMVIGLSAANLASSKRGDRAFAKIGIADGKFFDCVLIRRTDVATNKLLRYVMVALDAPASDAGENLYKSIGVEFDKCIRKNNGISP
jgi:hypothetical protein